MSDFVNKIKTKDGTEYDIQDARMPEVPSGGTKLYKHEFDFNNEDLHLSGKVVFVNNKSSSSSNNDILRSLTCYIEYSITDILFVLHVSNWSVVDTFWYFECIANGSITSLSSTISNEVITEL